jgi:ABC-type proline/glycine betaine transport system ATPase subunit
MLDVTVPDMPQIQIAIGQGERISHFKIIMPVSGEGKSTLARVGMVKR